MTTRTRITDTRVAVALDCGTHVSTGLYFRKEQSGANDPINRHAINGYSMNELLIVNPVLTFSTIDDPRERSCTWLAAAGGVVVPDTSFSAADLNRLANKLGEKVKSHSFNAAVSVGAEGKEALEQVAAKTMEVYRGFRNLKKGNIQGALREFGISPKETKRVGLHKDLSGRVLATQLGWIPLLSDIKDGAEAFHALTVTPKSQTYVAGIRNRSEVFSAYGAGDTIVMGEVSRSRRIHWTLSEELSWNESLGLSNPWDFADAVWNATTLSFVADWFIPIGGYLEARSLASTLVGSGYYTDFYKYHGRGIDGWLPPYNSINVSGGGGFYQSYTEVNRVLLSSLDGLVALPSWKDLKKVPSWKRALTAVALATQMFL